ncbi:MAG: Abi family protein [Candidatus Thiodiazotropha endolucinida]|nr:Abi family protein [Candidatus Thiodiazotropha taylori]MCW4261079.1 Abi family protein [Candidatus Thiodiazotropha endolucinida]MCG8102343.1 Abi family protein [Candidatus Thiodiazotropha taylori]MCG8120895.1 Abi family protein [Candidatus Thiodiazotropha taylori]MCW4287666.1 Abi family protein [Candidatus Thiodiazotropha endolucinida]
MKFNKPPLSFQDQLQQLEQRGLVVTDRLEAEHYLSHLNYYRLAAYLLPFEQDHATHQLQPGTTFDQVLDLYIFDRELRLLMLDAIERVEVSIRTQLAYALAHRHGPHALLDKGLFKAKWRHDRNLDSLQREVGHSREVFICHLRQKYDEPLPPVWAAVEIMTFGQLSKWYANLSSGADRNAVAHTYDMDEINLVSFLHHLSTVRNVCAHHSRLWNREFTFTFKLPRKRPSALVAEMYTGGHGVKRLYNTLVLLAYLMDKTCMEHHWKQRLKGLIANHNIDTSKMGFPADWQTKPIWQ